jgi:hypothetical protein
MRSYYLRRHEEEHCPYQEKDNDIDECSPTKKSRDAETDEDDELTSSHDDKTSPSLDDHSSEIYVDDSNNDDDKVEIGIWKN